MTLASTHATILIQSHLALLISSVLAGSALLLGSTARSSQHWSWETREYNLKTGALLTVTLCFCCVLAGAATRQLAAGGADALYFLAPVIQLRCALTDLSLLFLLLVSTLMPAVLVLSDLDRRPSDYKFVLLLLLIYLVASLLILTSDMLAFYVLYEFLILLVFLAMYTSTNARGCAEASLFFLGWAALGSILVSVAVLHFIAIAGSTNFAALRACTLTTDEAFYLSALGFLGFGTKLSLWPFWYWLPRAHVEVSTAMSIFLSCVLLKVCLYCLMRFWWLLNSEIAVSPFIFLVALCVFDVTCRLIVQVDLKAIIAYGSVLHINLLVLLVLLDTRALTPGTIFYIWGHSLSTAGLFYAVSLIERCYGTRATFEISGVYHANPIVGLLTAFAVIGFLDFPLSVFFWGELWLWVTLFSVVPVGAALLMFVSSALYIIIFFRIWWGLIFGASSAAAKLPVVSITWNDVYTAGYLIFSQYLLGLQPDLLLVFHAV